ncbi:MAG TPA: hypothetical protein VK879_19105 [Candidatus Sulfomarinibacteraceae bacterium]|nr:hypothetical protein [Candidatus Sulfomarinibacteraceae bacterium]
MTDKEVHKLQGKRMIEQNTPRQQYEGEFQKEAKEHRATLERIIENGVATRVRILANHDSCPVCKALEGAYDFEDAPALPHEGCSHPLGCRCHYAPVLDRFGP